MTRPTKFLSERLKLAGGLETGFVFQSESWQQSSVCCVTWSSVKGHLCFLNQYNLELFLYYSKERFWYERVVFLLDFLVVVVNTTALEC